MWLCRDCIIYQTGRAEKDLSVKECLENEVSSFTTQNNCKGRSKMHNPQQISVPGDALATTPFILSIWPGTEEFLPACSFQQFSGGIFIFFLSNFDTVIPHLFCEPAMFSEVFLFSISTSGLVVSCPIMTFLALVVCGTTEISVYFF